MARKRGSSGGGTAHPAAAAAASAGIAVDVSTCCYDLVRDAATSRGWTLLEPGDEAERRAHRANVYWTDRSVTRTRVSCLAEHQMINHFPGMVALTSKSQLATNLRKMEALHPDEYSFVPQSWLLPEDLHAFQHECRRSRKSREGAMYIVKPERGCQGRNIFLTSDADDAAVKKAAWYGAVGGDMLVAQQYIQAPFVFYSHPADKGYKFDLRLYVVVTSCDPLRAYLYADGLVRFCTEPYSRATEGNKDWQYMHLSNYSVNKNNSANFSDSSDASDPTRGSKRRLAIFFDLLKREGQDVDTLWGRLEEMTAKSLIAVQPLLKHYYRLCQPADKFGDRCFEVRAPAPLHPAPRAPQTRLRV